MNESKMMQQLEEAVHVTRSLQRHVDDIQSIGTVLVRALRTGGKIFVCGNGGSAAQAQHFATELVGRFRHNRQPLPAQALAADGSLLTCIGNDFHFRDVFSRQVQAFGIAGDVLIGLSTSGRSDNVLQALERARNLGLTTIGLTGNDGRAMEERCDYVLGLPSQHTARIQEGHLIIIHLLCEIIEAAFGP